MKQTRQQIPAGAFYGQRGEGGWGNGNWLAALKSRRTTRWGLKVSSYANSPGQASETSWGRLHRILGMRQSRESRSGLQPLTLLAPPVRGQRLAGRGHEASKVALQPAQQK